MTSDQYSHEPNRTLVQILARSRLLRADLYNLLDQAEASPHLIPPHKAQFLARACADLDLFAESLAGTTTAQDSTAQPGRPSEPGTGAGKN
jgi:hypothetical protein